jgi:hypothetical protein
MVSVDTSISLNILNKQRTLRLTLQSLEYCCLLSVCVECSSSDVVHHIMEEGGAVEEVAPEQRTGILSIC